MEAVLFTKLFRGRSLEEIAEVTRGLGFDGVDLLVRAGHQVEPTEPDKIAGAVRLLKDTGLTVPIVTTDITDSVGAPTERLFRVCAEAGVAQIRLGYWKYDPTRGYAAILEQARGQLQRLGDLARQAGVKVTIQLHGGTIHGSGSQAAALLAGYDPAHVGAYADPGNQVVQEGREDWRFTLDVLEPWLCCIGVKNGGWFPSSLAPSGQRHWWSDWQGIADGMVPWDDIAAHLVKTEYSGHLSFHSHYEVPLEQVYEQTRLDLQYFRRQLGAVIPQSALAQ